MVICTSFVLCYLIAHYCIFLQHRQNLNYLTVRVGEWDTQNDFEPFPYQDIQVQEVIIHENFNPNVLYHDVALLFLKASKITSFILVLMVTLPHAQ